MLFKQRITGIVFDFFTLNISIHLQEREEKEENLEVKVEQDGPQTPFFLIAGVCVSVVLALLFFLFFGRSSGGRQMKKGV